MVYKKLLKEKQRFQKYFAPLLNKYTPSLKARMFTKIKIFFTQRIQQKKSALPKIPSIVTLTVQPVPSRFVRFTTKEKVLFAKRLSFLIKSNVSIRESIVIIRNQTKSKRIQHIFDTIIHNVTAGQFLSTALEQYKNIFGEFTIHIIRVGENTGVLSDNLTYLADELTKRHTLQRKIQSALIYPLFIIIATFGVTGMLTVFIFPKIMPIFISLNVSLPPTTRALLAISEYLAEWWHVTILGCVLIGIICGIARIHIYTFCYATDWLLLKLPIVGTLTRSYNYAHFCRTLGLTLASGIPLSEALDITATVTKNVVYKEAYQVFAKQVLTGENIATVMNTYPTIFTDMLPHMIHIGETTGALSQTLGYLSDLYEADIDESTRNLSNALEPILLMVMGIMVGIVAISIITPIYEITKHISTIR